MSYTPESQRIDEPLDDLLPKFAPVREAMLERLRNREGWKEDHLNWLERAVKDMQDLEMLLLKLRQGAL